MVTKTNRGVYGPRKSCDLPDYFTGDEMISERQKRLLTAFILSIQDEDERDQRLLELEDMSSNEADDMLFEVSRWI